MAWFRNKNRKGVLNVTDAVVAVIILNLVSATLYSGIQYFYQNVRQMKDDVHTEILLTECAEVVQSVRYGEWDRGGAAGWENFRATYPTGVYVMAFDEPTKSWSLNPVVSGGTHIADMRTVRQLQLDDVSQTGSVVERIRMGTSQRDEALRYVTIDTNAPNQTTVKCLVKYDFNKRLDSSVTDDGNDYEELKFVMMNYL